MSKFAKAEPMNPIAKQWIATQKEEYIAEDKQLLAKIKKCKTIILYCNTTRSSINNYLE